MSDGKARHSPGPWRWDSDWLVLLAPNPRRGQGYPPESDFLVLAIAEDHSVPPGPADAALIADAPAMLELLRKIDSECSCEEFHPAVHEALHALIDKHGRSP